MNEIEPAPRPEDEEGPPHEDPEFKGRFMECDACRAWPGWPVLCRGCLHNQAVILRLSKGRPS